MCGPGLPSADAADLQASVARPRQHYNHVQRENGSIPCSHTPYSTATPCNRSPSKWAKWRPIRLTQPLQEAQDHASAAHNTCAALTMSGCCWPCTDERQLVLPVWPPTSDEKICGTCRWPPHNPHRPHAYCTSRLAYIVVPGEHSHRTSTPWPLKAAACGPGPLLLQA